MADFRGNHHHNEVYPQLDRPTTLQSQNPSSTPDSVTQTEGGHNGILPGRNPLSGTPAQNQPSLQRRRSYQPTYATLQRAPNPTGRGLSMAGFGAGAAVPAGFQFSQSPASAHSASPVVPQSLAALNHPSDTLSMSTLPHDLVDEMESTNFANMGANRVITGHQNLNMFDPPTFDNPFEQTRMGPAGPGFTMGANGRDTSMHGGHPSHQAPLHASIENIDMLPFPNAISATEGIPTGPSHTFHQNLPAADQMNVDSDRLRAPQHDLEAAVQPPQSLSYPLPTLQSSEGRAAQDGAAVTHSRIETQSMPQLPQKSVYSKSGFDMMRALNKVANRKNPEVNIGAVDMSCAFLVCDVTLNDCPIVYVSDSFENLTGYTRHEIVGKNCRFLQAPDGHVEAGVRREFVDDAVVFRLKQRIAAGREVQESLINYRKGGKPFLNLLTAVPISWDTEEIRFFVGFQIDLVECPQAISSDRGAGGVKVDYANSSPGRYTWEPPVSRQLEVRSGQTLGMDDVSTLLQQFFAKGAVASDWHKQSWHKMLLENADDVIHVISLKGAFQYISPSCKRVLEYDPTELAGSSLSSICHPSDIVPVTRELKDASGDALVNIVFRIRRKHSGYMWFESHGSLFSEHGKGRKCIILLGRRRPTFALSRQALINHGGSIGDNEIWTKLTTSGMLLFVSPSARPLLDLQPDTLIGTSFQDLMRKESRVEFGRTIEKARRGKIVSCKHEIHNRRGQALLAQTFFYPGDGDDSKPSFLLAQTKLVKSPSRSLAASNSGLDSKQSSARLSSNTPSWDSDSGGRSPSGLDTEDLMFAELGATKCSSWQFELRQMEKHNRILTDELNMLLSSKKKRKRRKGGGNVVRDCANCHTQNTPEWRRGPSGQRDLCNSCGLRWAKHAGRASSRNSSRGSGGNGDSHGRLSNVSSVYSSPKAQEIAGEEWGDAERSSSGNGDKISSDSGGHDVSPGSAATASPTERAQPLPPHSQPQLEGGSGTGMTAIREE